MMLQVAGDRKLVLHFFIKEVTLEQFIALEKSCLESTDYGKEVSSLSGMSSCD